MRVQRTLTITASTPINIVTGLTAAGGMTGFGRLAPVWCRSLNIQALAGGTGYVTVMDGIYGVQADGVSPRIPSALGATSGDLTVQLSPAGSATNPGGDYSDSYALNNQQGGIDVSRCWVDGSHTGDTVVVSYDVIGSKL